MITPPSTLSAAPVVAEASVLATYATSDATSFVVAKRLITEVGKIRGQTTFTRELPKVRSIFAASQNRTG